MKLYGGEYVEQRNKPEEAIFRDISKNSERPRGSRESKGTCKGNPRGNPEENVGLEITDYEGEVLEKLAETFNAGLSNTVRIRMLGYCLQERSFSAQMRKFLLNPASLKHHQDLLQENALIEKTGKGKDTRYKTTFLGKTLLNFVGAVLKVLG